MLEKEEKRNFAWPVSSVNKMDYERLIGCVQENIDFFKARQIIIYGAGIRGTEAAKILKEKGFDHLTFTDNNPEKWGGYINEFPIVQPDQILKKNGEIVILVSVEKGEEIIDSLKGNGFIEGRDFFYPVTTQYELIEDEVFRDCSKCTLVLGDCLFTKISFHDKDDMTKSLTDMIYDFWGKKNTKVLAIPGFNMRSFYHLVQEEILRGNDICRVILEINFDTMNGKQHLLPRVQHPDLFYKIYEKIKQNGISAPEFEDYVAVTKRRAQNYSADFFTQFSHGKNRKIEDLEYESSRLYFILHYMYVLKEENECIYFLEKLLVLLEEHDIQVIPFCPPVNYQYATEIFGEEFTKYYNDNLSVLKKILVKHKLELLDLSYSLSKKEFAEENTSDETSNYIGRRCIANAIFRRVEGR